LPLKKYQSQTKNPPPPFLTPFKQTQAQLGRILGASWAQLFQKNTQKSKKQRKNLPFFSNFRIPITSYPNQLVSYFLPP